jgi:hypothetical protein
MDRDGGCIFYKRDKCLRVAKGGNYLWVLIQIEISEFYFQLGTTFYFLVECMRAQLLNTWKRVAVESHIPFLLGASRDKVQSTLGKLRSQLVWGT